MYLQHFGLAHAPFSNTPDTRFFYRHPGHEEALNVLQLALRSGEGFIKIVGEVGTGKTLLCRKLLAGLGPAFATAYIPNPFLNPNTLRAALADELNVDAPRNLGQHRLLKLITSRLMQLHREGKRVVVIVDEAQAMPEESLEALRLLSNLETERYKLLQLVLFGQPELDARLARPGVRQLRQRITFGHRLSPLDRDGVGAYIRHRLVVAGRPRADLLAPEAVHAIYKGSGGIPRVVNVLTHKALMAAYGEGAGCVEPRHVRRAIADTEALDCPARLAGGRLVYGTLSLAAAAGASYAALLLWGSPP
ncbi:MAG: AAA family ATPase [Gammaproteobacteria bacterium]|nr:AAA family ATPase [Gammaproteobacteria bacterium]